MLVCPRVPFAAVGGLGGPIGRLYRWLDQVPYALLALPLRLAVATVFWNSGMTKLADWNATLSLFTDEYQVPLLPPELAANLALAIEVTTPVLLVLGLADPARRAGSARHDRRDRDFRLSAGLADAHSMGRDAAGPALPRRRKRSRSMR